MHPRDLSRIHQCLGDETRLRMMALLLAGPLCVCHFQGILRLPQVKTSRHLATLRENGLVEVTRNANWRIYSLPAHPGAVLDHVIEGLRRSCEEIPQLRRDLAARQRLEEEIAASTGCCAGAGETVSVLSK
jgi:DNA-binding transcriptional ArsR family regulator